MPHDVELEVGKIYVTEQHLIDGNDDFVGVPSYVQKIIGLIPEDSLEYALGFRFYSDQNERFHPNGSNLSKGNRSVGSLGKEANDTQKRNYPDYTVIPQTMRDDPSRFLPKSDRGFEMKVGNIYLNSMGIPVLCTGSMMRDKPTADKFTLSARFHPPVFRSGRAWVARHGQSVKLRSIYDLIYQRV
jgi:hypothetical protein